MDERPADEQQQDSASEQPDDEQGSGSTANTNADIALGRTPVAEPDDERDERASGGTPA